MRPVALGLSAEHEAVRRRRADHAERVRLARYGLEPLLPFPARRRWVTLVAYVAPWLLVAAVGVRMLVGR